MTNRQLILFLAPIIIAIALITWRTAAKHFWRTWFETLRTKPVGLVFHLFIVLFGIATIILGILVFPAPQNIIEICVGILLMIPPIGGIIHFLKSK